MSVEITQLKVKGARDGGIERAVTVERGTAASVVRVVWSCGESRNFNEDDLRHHIKVVDAMKGHNDVWTTLEDSYGSKFVARVEDGFLIADTRMSDATAGVPWDDFKKAVKKLLG